MIDQTGGGRDAAPQFVVVDDTDDAASVPAEVRPEAAAAIDPLRLNAVRVRQLSALRRATYRVRSYYVVALGVCAVAIVQLAAMTVRHVRAAGWQLRPVGYLCGILAAAMAGTYFYRRAAQLTGELRPQRGVPAGGEETRPDPDFSSLGNGSDTWKNLEQMREGS